VPASWRRWGYSPRRSTMAGRPDHECFVCKGSAPPLVQCDRTGCTLVRFAAATLLPQARFTVAAAAARPAAAANAAADCPNLLTGIHLWRLTCASRGVGCRHTMPSASVDPCCTLEWSGTAVRRHCSCTFIRPAAPTRSSLSEAPGIFLLPTLLGFQGVTFVPSVCVRVHTGARRVRWRTVLSTALQTLSATAAQSSAAIATSLSISAQPFTP
jgi:hypothetical protein